MIECDVCGRYVPADNIRDCPNENCTLELCKSCYEKHVAKCLNNYDNYDSFKGDENMQKNINIMQNALAGLYIGDNPDILETNPMKILDIARSDERLDSFGEAFVAELTQEELIETIQGLNIEHVEIDEFGSCVDLWKICNNI